MRKTIKYLLVILAAVILLPPGLLCLLYLCSDLPEPRIDLPETAGEPATVQDSLRLWQGNSLRLNTHGLWEMHLGGDAFERGYAAGKLCEDLLYYQEKAFVDQIRELIPSDSYLKFLRFFLKIYNRRLDDHINQEYKDEIYGLSLACTHEYDIIGSPYERQLNYHAAHDIGHALQDLMLVGCSSFAVWGETSADSALLVGRNFDFYMGDDFARNRIVLFVSPDEGYRFASVTWPGMVGVLSGMNEQGLTVTINAAKSSVPFSSATPISLLTREILQYASTIDEAYAIARRRETFVSESILISSAQDGRAAVIEKSPDAIGLAHGEATQIVCTNHFRSDTFRDDPRNVENIRTTDSPYRYRRLEELIGQARPLTPDDAAAILRNRHGMQDSLLGLTNEMAINQFIAHHSVVFQPEQRIMWVSTSPWQSGEYVAYDLKKIFSGTADCARELTEPQLAIAPDPFLLSPGYGKLLAYKRLSRLVASAGTTLPADTLALLEQSNPGFFHTYELLGDYYKKTDPGKADACYRKALTLPIGRLAERERIQKKIKCYDKEPANTIPAGQ